MPYMHFHNSPVYTHHVLLSLILAFSVSKLILAKATGGLTPTPLLPGKLAVPGQCTPHCWTTCTACSTMVVHTTLLDHMHCLQYHGGAHHAAGPIALPAVPWWCTPCCWTTCASSTSLSAETSWCAHVPRAATQVPAAACV